jgi:hypothetical protein
MLVNMHGKYTWQEFYEIEKESKYILSEKIVELLHKLSEDIGIPANALNENNTNNHNNTNAKNANNYNGNRNNMNNSSNNHARVNGIRNPKSKIGEDNWDNIKKNEVFKKTEMVKIEKSEIEKIIQEIRISLNKMTDKNYVKQRDEIKNKMKSIMETEEIDESEREVEDPLEETGKKVDKSKKEEEWQKVGKILFDIASTNKFFSKIYAQLYLELIEEFALFQEIVDTFIEGFILKLQTIQYVDPDKDYDGYCKYTKQQDERKAMTGFLVHLGVGYLSLGEKGVEMVAKLQQIVAELTEKVVGLIDKESSTNEVEEITEILFLFFSVGGNTLINEWKKGGNWEEGVSDKMLFLSKQKVKEHPSLSSRALFKFSDIQKIIVK